jgi:hypothetical protein
MYPTCPSRATAVRRVGDSGEVSISSAKDFWTPLTIAATPTPMMTSPATMTITRPPGHPSTPEVACC